MLGEVALARARFANEQEGPLGRQRDDGSFDEGVLAEELAGDRHLDRLAVDLRLERLAADDVREDRAWRQLPRRRRPVGVVLPQRLELIGMPTLRRLAQYLGGRRLDRLFP